MGVPTGMILQVGFFHPMGTRAASITRGTFSPTSTTPHKPRIGSRAKGPGPIIHLLGVVFQATPQPPMEEGHL